MAATPQSLTASLLLTNRLVDVGAAPLTASHFWRLVQTVDPADLLGLEPAEIAERAGMSPEESQRIRTLLNAVTAFAFAQERLLDGGVTVVSALDDCFPATLRDRLGAGCPPFLLTAGPMRWAEQPGLGVVGPRVATEEQCDVARHVTRAAANHGWSVISGGASGVDQAAQDAAVTAGAAMLVVPGEGIVTTARRAEVRRLVHSHELSLLSPYAPTAPFSVGNAMGRNKIIYALSQVTFVVACEEGKGGSWAGATDALSQKHAPVAVWAGTGATRAHLALVERGALPVTDLEDLFVLDATAVEPADTTGLRRPVIQSPATQERLF